MSVQFLVLNQTSHDVVLKLKKDVTPNKWYAHHCSSFSWFLPVSAKCDYKYKIRHNNKTIAVLWLTHTGHITGIKNKSHDFFVTTNACDCEHCRCCMYTGQLTIFIMKPDKHYGHVRTCH